VPIKPKLRRELYNTRHWRLQRARILERAGQRCECNGECGKEHDGDDDDVNRCSERHLKPATGDGVRRGALVSLTTAHFNHDSGARVPDSELRAWCVGCHLRWDLEQHLQARYVNRQLALEKRGQRRLF
jgi:hypothetical protein